MSKRVGHLAGEGLRLGRLELPEALAGQMKSVKKLTTKELVDAKPTEDEFFSLPRHPISVVCDNIRSLENVGLIFRISDAARVAKLYLCGITGYPALASGDPRPLHVAERASRVIAKTAIDTARFVPWEYRERAVELIATLRAAGWQIVAIEQTSASIKYSEAQYRFPVCLVIGHEREGVDAELLAAADELIHVPMYGMGNSLNVSTAYAVAVYELLGRLGRR